MRQVLFAKFRRVYPGMKPAILVCALYRELTNDDVADPTNLHEAEIDERVKLVLEMEDHDVVTDLQHLNNGQEQCVLSRIQKVSAGDIGMAIDNRRHDTVTHQSKAISVHNLRDQVRARYPEGTIFCQNRGCDGSSGLKLPIHV